MKYIYYIIFILIVLSGAVFYELRSGSDTTNGAALIINKRVITVDEFDKLYSSLPPRLKDRNEFINSLITKEVMIQEAETEGIDKDESFRRSIQNFYEQSLIKLLMDRKLASLRSSLTDEDLNKYISLWNKVFCLTIFSFNSEKEAAKGSFEGAESRSSCFEDLTGDIRDKIFSLKEGQTTGPIKSGDKFIVVRLDKVRPSLRGAPSEAEKEEIRRLLLEERKEKIVNEWVSDLRKKASVKILTTGEK